MTALTFPSIIQSHTIDAGVFLNKPVNCLLPLILYSLDNCDYVAHALSIQRVTQTYFSLLHMLYIFRLLHAVIPMHPIQVVCVAYLIQTIHYI